MQSPTTAALAPVTVSFYPLPDTLSCFFSNQRKARERRIYLLTLGKGLFGESTEGIKLWIYLGNPTSQVSVKLRKLAVAVIIQVRNQLDP